MLVSGTNEHPRILQVPPPWAEEGSEDTLSEMGDLCSKRGHYSCLRSFTKYLLSTYCVPGAVGGTGDRAVKNANQSPSAGGVDGLGGERDKQPTINVPAPGERRAVAERHQGTWGRNAPWKGARDHVLAEDRALSPDLSHNVPSNPGDRSSSSPHFPGEAIDSERGSDLPKVTS